MLIYNYYLNSHRPQIFKKPYFVLGIAAFAIAHVMYMLAFGFEHSWWKTGVGLALWAVGFWKFVTKNLKGIMVKAVGIYAWVISLMVWRSISRINRPSDLKTSWTKLCSCIGTKFSVSTSGR